MLSTSNIDEQVSHYADNSFDAELAARYFFSDHTENEVHKKLNELAALQTQIENILRQEVRENYSLFLFANTEIQHIGGEMADLKSLLSFTQQMLAEVRMLRSNGLQYMSAPSRPSTAPRFTSSAASSDTNKPNITTTSSRDAIPAWLLGASDDIDRFIIEHQYKQAVKLIHRCSSYLDSVRSIGVHDYLITPPASTNTTNANSSHSTSASTVVAISGNSPASSSCTGTGYYLSQQLKRKSASLASTLRQSLAQLPNSQLWGMAEQRKRLRLLISLGYSDLAAEGFASGQVDIIRRALRYVEAAGDTELYTSELAKVFFYHLDDACRHFLALFSGSNAADDANVLEDSTRLKPSVFPVNSKPTPSSESDLSTLAFLVSWIQTQMNVFVTALARQIQVGASECSARIFELPVSDILKLCPTYQTSDANTSAPSSPTKDSASPATMGVSALPAGSRRSLVRTVSLVEDTKLGEGSPAATYRRKSAILRKLETLKRDGDDVAAALGIVGPLTFVSRCLHVAFREASVLDALRLQGRASLGWHILPEVRTIMNSLADDVIRIMDTQIEKEEWTCATTDTTQLQLKLLSPTSVNSADGVTGHSVISAVSALNAPDEDASPAVRRKKSSLTSLFARSDGDDLDASSSPTPQRRISHCYLWTVASVSYVVSQMWSLVLASDLSASSVPNSTSSLTSVSNITNKPRAISPAFSNPNSSSKISSGKHTALSFSRVDMCELEPDAVACVLRIIVRFVRGVLSINKQNMDSGQLECYLDTLHTITNVLLPSAEEVISSCFFSDGSSLVTHPPHEVFALLRLKISEMTPISEGG